MIIKTADSRAEAILGLQTQIARPDLSPEERSRLQTTLRKVRAGATAEAAAAYEIDFHCGDEPRQMVIHDLRLEVEGRTAQIDHVIIDRFFQVWVCESKSFRHGVEIDDHGDWYHTYEGKRVGIESPIDQNQRHILVLRDAFDRGLVAGRTKLGRPIRPSFKGLVLISNDAPISWPANRDDFPELASVIKVGRFRAALEKDADARSVRIITRLLETSELERVARQVAGLHRAKSFQMPVVPRQTVASQGRRTPPRAGQPWTEDEDARLVASAHRGDSIDEMASRHERNVGGITARLEKLGLVDSGAHAR